MPRAAEEAPRGFFRPYRPSAFLARAVKHAVVRLVGLLPANQNWGDPSRERHFPPSRKVSGRLTISWKPWPRAVSVIQ